MPRTSAADEQGDLTLRPGAAAHADIPLPPQNEPALPTQAGDRAGAVAADAPPAPLPRVAGPPPVVPPVAPGIAPPVAPPVVPPVRPPRAPRAVAVAAPAISGTGLPRRRGWRHVVQAAATSAVVHATLLVALGLLLIEVPSIGQLPPLIAAVATARDAVAVVRLEPQQSPGATSPAAPVAELTPHSAVHAWEPLEAIPTTNGSRAENAGQGSATVGLELPVGERPLASVGIDLHGQLAGRRPQLRGALLEAEGGTPQSEAAVLRGLRWLAAHQQQDGSWNFNHHLGTCAGRCRNPGTHASTTAATALVLLAFLGHGETHREGEFCEAVRRGLYYLLARGAETPHGLDLQEGTMYAQGLAAMALCEAYALTHDRGLQRPAQRALDFIVYAQDKQGGGWRYSPGMPGDTTVTGWQLMALRSGQMAYLVVPDECLEAAARFLDSVQQRYGACYGYQTPGQAVTTTSIGLLCRMYQGWQRTHEGLAAGVALLAAEGPSPDNMYYNYYATQVLHHWGGRPWDDWNQKMRERLIADQVADGHESGSWHYTGGRAAAGGRLYNTAMAVMTLEVYYRHLPLYRDTAVALQVEQ